MQREILTGPSIVDSGGRAGFLVQTRGLLLYRQEIEAYLLTRKRSRRQLPEYGSRVHNLLLKLMHLRALVPMIRRYVADDLRFGVRRGYLPYFEVGPVKVTPFLQSNAITVRVTFAVPVLDQRDEAQVKFRLSREVR
ncbi:MAG: hypothetical protein KJ621_05510 [Proteobacteria bacterium]|nr:hypothetical protein [Pseudomonadota bacterium]MBU1740884.1 hypothetical protein [Pseudomonadota bacterium]